MTGKQTSSRSGAAQPSTANPPWDQDTQSGAAARQRMRPNARDRSPLHSGEVMGPIRTHLVPRNRADNSWGIVERGFVLMHCNTHFRCRSDRARSQETPTTAARRTGGASSRPAALPTSSQSRAGVSLAQPAERQASKQGSGEQRQRSGLGYGNRSRECRT